MDGGKVALIEAFPSPGTPFPHTAPLQQVFSSSSLFLRTATGMASLPLWIRTLTCARPHRKSEDWAMWTRIGSAVILFSGLISVMVQLIILQPTPAVAIPFVDCFVGAVGIFAASYMVSIVRVVCFCLPGVVVHTQVVFFKVSTCCHCVFDIDVCTSCCTHDPVPNVLCSICAKPQGVSVQFAVRIGGFGGAGYYIVPTGGCRIDALM